MPRIPVAAIGLPGLAVFSIGGVLFIATLFIARARRAPDDQGSGQREAKSWAGIIVQAAGILSVGFGQFMVRLDPMSAAALLHAAVVGLCMAMTVGLFHSSSKAMGRNWAIVASTRSDHQLVTSGPFAYVRNPIYVALFFFMLAMSFAYGHYAGLIPGIPLFVIGTMMRVRIEERLLRTQFGDAYDAYAARVKRFVPGLI